MAAYRKYLLSTKTYSDNNNKIIGVLVGRVGFEPTTPAMSRRYLNQARPPALIQ
jgi:hypothetical protein